MDYVNFHPVLSILSYLLKAPLVPAGTPVVNSLFRQRAAIENILRACIGLGPISHMSLEQRVSYLCTNKGKVLNNITYYANIFRLDFYHQFDLASTSDEPAPKRAKSSNGISNGNF